MEPELEKCPHCWSELELNKKTELLGQIDRDIEWWEASCTSKCGYLFRAYDCGRIEAIDKVNRRSNGVANNLINLTT